jgi:hypothetical protein
LSEGGGAATVAVMTAMRERRLLWLRWNAPEWRTLERGEGFQVFERSFLAFPHRMVVVQPDFANFASKYKQSFAYLPLSAFAPSRSPAPERDFLRRCLARIRPEFAERGESAEVLYLDGRFVGDRKNGVGIEWLAPFDVVEKSAKVVSKRTCLDSIVPALEHGIGPEEGGVYTPYAGDGMFHLLSM